MLLYNRGDYSGALEKYNEALRIKKAHLSHNHPEIATILGNIAGVLDREGDYDGALEKHNEALRIYESYWGQNHTDVAKELNNIGTVLIEKNDYDEALKNFNAALRIWETLYGRNHHQVATAITNIGQVLEAKDDYDGAMEKYIEALRITQIYFGSYHSNVALILSGIAGILEKQGKHAEALKKYNETLAVYKKSVDHNNPAIGVIYWNIAYDLSEQRHFKEALVYYDSALTILKVSFDPKHPQLQRLREHQREAYIASFPPQQQWSVHTQLLLKDLREPATTLSASDSLDFLNGIGVGYIKQSKGDSALYYLQQALPIAERLRNQKEMLGLLYNNLGAANKIRKDWPTARQWLEKSLHHNSVIFDEGAKVLAYTYFHLAGVAQAESQTNLSREYAQKSLALAEHHKLTELRAEVEALMKQKR